MIGVKISFCDKIVSTYPPPHLEFAYNIVSYINRINHEPKIIGGLFKDLECELYTLAIAIGSFYRDFEKNCTNRWNYQEKWGFGCYNNNFTKYNYKFAWI